MGFFWRRAISRCLLAALAVTVGLTAASSAGGAAAAAGPGDWTTYLGNLSRTGFNGAETAISVTSAPSLTLKWTGGSAGHLLFSQPVVAGGLIYWGSFDGYERATTTAGGPVWQTYLGQTTPAPPCSPPSAGVASTATVSNVAVGASTSVLYVGGGDAHMYALDALTGAVLWSTSLGSSPSHFIWSSPAVYNGSVYIGVASYGDCPLVQGQLVQLDAATGAIRHVFNVVPNGCTGAGVWATPAIDAAAGTLYFATGNSGTCTSTETLAESVVELNAADLSLRGSWAVPVAEQGRDGDFGATPTLFSFTRLHKLHRMVGLVNKNGTYYAFARDALGAGPTWRARISKGGPGPQVGTADIAPSAWDGSHLYVAGAVTTIGGVSCPGVIFALDPASGRTRWRDCLTGGAVLGAVTAVPGVVTVGEGAHILLLAGSDGHALLDFATMGKVWGAATISNGALYQGDLAGNLYALGP